MAVPMAMSTAEPNACSPLRHRLSSAAAESAVAAEARREEQLRTGDFADEFHPLDTRPLLMSRLHKAMKRQMSPEERDAAALLKKLLGELAEDFASDEETFKKRLTGQAMNNRLRIALQAYLKLRVRARNLHKFLVSQTGEPPKVDPWRMALAASRASRAVTAMQTLPQMHTDIYVESRNEFLSLLEGLQCLEPDVNVPFRLSRQSRAEVASRSGPSDSTSPRPGLSRDNSGGCGRDTNHNITDYDGDDGDDVDDVSGAGLAIWRHPRKVLERTAGDFPSPSPSPPRRRYASLAADRIAKTIHDVEASVAAHEAEAEEDAATAQRRLKLKSLYQKLQMA